MGKYTQINDGVKRVWDVERIWKLAEELPEIEIPIEEINGLDEVTWFSPDTLPTVRTITDHCNRINNCDLDYAIILTETNCVFDGMHRLARQFLDGKTRVLVKKFDVNPEPDETTCVTNEIDSTKSLVTKNILVNGLRKMGIEEGDTLLVHSSLSSLGWVCGGAQAVIEALMEVTGIDGNIVMPAHSSDWSDPTQWENPAVPEEWHQIIFDNMPAFNPDATPTRGVGIIPELFRTFPGVMRSNHPQVSFSAWGKLKEKIIKKHPLTPQFGEESPLGTLYNLDDVKVLMLGTGYDTCTSFHLGEVLSENIGKVKMGSSIMENGLRTWKWFEDYLYDSQDFSIIGEEFEQKNKINTNKIGNAQCSLYSMKDAVDFSKKWLLKNRKYKDKIRCSFL